MASKADNADEVGRKVSTTSLLEGFVTSDRRAIIQENVYIILGHGKFQRRVLVCAIISLIVLLLHAFAYRLIGRAVDHWCKPPKDLLHLTVQEWKNVGIPVRPDGSFSQCTVYDPPLPENEEERHEVRCNQWAYETPQKGDSIISYWDLVCDWHWLYSLSSSFYMLGSMLFVPLAGLVSDRLGRKPSIMASAVALLFASLGTASSHSFVLFMVCRFFVSATASSTNLLVFTLLYEVTGHERRALYGLLATCIGPTVAPPLLQVLSLFQPQWRLSLALLATATAFVAVWCYGLDESSAWQVATRHVRQAERTVLRAASDNGISPAKAKATFKALRTQLELLERGRSNSPSATSNTDRQLCTGSFRRRALSVLMSWFGVSFAFYGAGFRKPHLENHWALAGFILQVLLFVAVYDSMTRRGRRATLTSVLALLCVSGALQAVAVQWSLAPALPLAAVVVEGASVAAMSVNYCYTPEVFPTTIRSMGLCVAYSVGRLGALLASFVNHAVADKAPSLANAAMALLALVSALAVQWLPEEAVAKKASPQPVVTTEKERKEALKASLAEDKEGAKKAKRRKTNSASEHRKSKLSATRATPVTGTQSLSSVPQKVVSSLPSHSETPIKAP